MKAVVYEHRVNRRKELLQGILSASKTSTTLQCLVSLRVMWSHKSENVSKQMKDTS